MYFVLKSLKFIYIIPLYMFRTPLCPSSGASQLHMQSLVPCGAWFVVSSSPAVLYFISIIPFYMFRTPLCPSAGASQLHMQSLVPCGAWFIVSSSPATL